MVKIFKGIKKNVWAMGLVSLFTDISSEMIFPILPLFMANVLGVNKAVIGLIEGIAESTASLLKTFSGWLSDKLRKRKMLILAGYGLSTLIKPFLALSTAWQHVLALRFMERVGKGIRTSPRDALVAASSEKRFRGKAFGFNRSLDRIGAVMGILITFWLLTKFIDTLKEAGTYRLVFWLSVIPAIISVIIIIFFVKDIKHNKAENKIFKFHWKTLNKDYKKFIFVASIFGVANFSYAFLILRANELGVTVAFTPLIYLMSSIFFAGFAIPAGNLSDRIGRKKVLGLGYLFFSLMCFGFVYLSGWYFAWILFALYGLSLAFTDAVSRAFVSDLVKEGERGTAIGIYHTCIGFAAFPASFVFGNLWNFLGSNVAFWFAAVLSLAASLLLFILLRKK
jgi:MFS family permease